MGYYALEQGAYNWSMQVTQKERDVIVERLAEIKADPNPNPEKPKPEQAREGEKLDQETTDLLRKLAEPPGPVSPTAGPDPTP
jgi:hypothetical protein